MRVIRVLLFLTAFVTALLAGYKVGKILDFAVDQRFSSKMETGIMPGATIPNNEQFNLLVIGVDDMDRPDAQLESIWLVANAENSSKITLVPVFPSISDQTHNLALAEAFQMHGSKPGKEFWDVMRESNFWWKGYLISDLNTSIRLIDSLGGVNINNQRMNGSQAVGSIPSWKNDISVALNQQKTFLESICNQISANQSLNMKSVSKLLDNNFPSNPQTKIFIAGWTDRGISNEKLICAFPTIPKTSLQLMVVSP